jgi:hypothetical protein
VDDSAEVDQPGDPAVARGGGERACGASLLRFEVGAVEAVDEVVRRLDAFERPQHRLALGDVAVVPGQRPDGLPALGERGGEPAADVPCRACDRNRPSLVHPARVAAAPASETPSPRSAPNAA